MTFQRMVRRAKLRLVIVIGKDSQAEAVENEMIEGRICLVRDMIQSVAADPEGKVQKNDGHRVYQSLDRKSLQVSRSASATKMSQKWEINQVKYC